MILVLRNDHTETEFKHLLQRIQDMGFTPHVSRGQTHTIVGAIGDATQDEPVSGHGCAEGSGVLDHDGRRAERDGLVGGILVLHLGVDGGDGEDRHVDRGVEHGETSELWRDAKLFDRWFSAMTVHRASVFFFAARVFAGVAGWNTSK